MNHNQKILWAGKPKQGIVFTGKDFFLIPFSLLWFGFTVFWTFSASGGKARVFFILWGLMFNCFGLYFVFGRFIHDSIKRSKTRYSITENNIIIKSRVETSIPIGEWSCLKMEKYQDGTGTILFANDENPFSNGSNTWLAMNDKIPQFFRIQEPDVVMGIIENLNKTKK